MVDWGDSASLSVELNGASEETEEKLAPSGLGRLQASIKHVRACLAGSIASLHELRDSGVHASTLAANRVPIGGLIKNYGFDALIDFGLSWTDMRDMGITGKQACSMNATQLRNLGVNAYLLSEVRPSIKDIASLRMCAAELGDFGFNQRLLQALGLSAKNMPQFGYTLQDWKDYLGVSEWKKLGFEDYSACERMGWSRSELHKAGVMDNTIETSAPVCRGRCAPRGALEF